MTEYTAEMAHAAARKGAAWMDEHCPGWVDQIDLDMLNMGCGEACILGQTTKCLLGDKYENYDSFGVVMDEYPDLDAVENGFDVTFQGARIGEGRARYEMLTIAWKELIRERLAAAAEQTRPLEPVA